MPSPRPSIDLTRVTMIVCCGAAAVVGATQFFLPFRNASTTLSGTVLLVVGVIGLGVFIVWNPWRPRRINPAAVAEHLIKSQKILYSGRHAYRPATPEDFRGLDRAFYEKSTRDLTAEGYRQLEDIYSLTLAEAEGRAVIRQFLGDRGETAAFVYHLLLPNVKKIKTIELCSELEDGTFVTTANNVQFDTSLGYPFVHRIQLPSSYSAPLLLETHRTHLKSVLDSLPGVKPVPMMTADDITHSQDRLQLRKNAHRHSADFNYRAEFVKVLGRPLLPHEEQIADRITAALRSRKTTGDLGVFTD